jgi:uncharacterized protein
MRVRNVLFRLFLIKVVFYVTIVNPSTSLAKAPTAKTVLWEISGNGLKRSSYLLGTRHAGCVKRLALSPEQKQALERVEQVYLEISPKKSNQSESTITIIQNKTNVFTSKKLKEQLTPAQYQFVEDYFGKDELDSLLSKNVDIFSLYIVVSEQLKEKTHDKLCSQQTTKERVILDAANDRKLPIFGVETQQERLGIVNSFLNNESNSGNAVNNLLNAIHTVNVINSNSILAEPVFQRIIKDDEQYFYQDIFGADKNNLGALDKPLIVDRNKLWLPRMQKVMVQKPTLFAFGSAHLRGNEGLISLLESRGYTLKPVYDSKVDTLQTSTSDSKAKEYYDAGLDDHVAGENLSALNNYDQAIKIWNRNNSKNANLAESYLSRGRLKGDFFSGFNGAVDDISKSILLDPTYAPAYFERGVLKMEKLGKYQEALLDFNRAITLNHNSLTTAKSHYYRGILKSSHLNDPKGALADFDTYLASKPQEVDALILRGVLKYVKLSDQSGGIADLRRAALLARNTGKQEKLSKALTALKIINVSETP